VTPPVLYSVDTSALLDGLERYYPEASFPALWKKIDELIAAGRFFFSEEVWDEARKHDAAAKTWCDARDKASLVVPTDAVIAREVQGILVAYPRLVANMKGRNRADAFVIAAARIKSATVVTGEGPDGNQNRPKIPYICQQLGVPCIRFLDIIRLEGWTF
jgi:hypothetical protein